MPSIKEKLALEEQNDRQIRLWPEGIFFKAYERSAYLFVSRVHHYEVHEEYYKGLARDAVHIAFPRSVLDTLTRDHKKATDGSEIIQLDSALDEQQFFLWRDAVRPAVPVKTPLPTPLVAEPPPMLAPPSIVEKTVTDRLREFNLASATPMEAMVFLNELQQMIRNDG